MKTWALNTAQAEPQISEISTGSLRANDNNGVSSAHDPALAFLDKALADNGPQSVIYLCFCSLFWPPTQSQVSTDPPISHLARSRGSAVHRV